MTIQLRSRIVCRSRLEGDLYAKAYRGALSTDEALTKKAPRVNILTAGRSGLRPGRDQLSRCALDSQRSPAAQALRQNVARGREIRKIGRTKSPERGFHRDANALWSVRTLGGPFGGDGREENSDLVRPKQDIGRRDPRLLRPMSRFLLSVNDRVRKEAKRRSAADCKSVRRRRFSDRHPDEDRRIVRLVLV